MTETMRKLFLFKLDEQRYALDFAAVERVTRIVEITPLPKAPAIVLGVVDVQGRILPVLDLRKAFHLPEREISLSDQLIIAGNKGLGITLLTQEVLGVAECTDRDVAAPESIFPGIEFVCGVAELGGRVVMICDLDRLCSEGKAADDAPHEQGGNGGGDG